MNLDNKVALVTGGASGLGQATVEKFVEKGAKTVILDINEDNANKIIEKRLSHAPVLKIDTPFFHLSSFLNDLGFSFHIKGNKIIR